MECEPRNMKLEQTLIDILKSADFDIDTELSVRSQAEKLLGVDLSDLNSKRLVRRLLEDFLLSTPPIDEVQKVEEVETEKFHVDERNTASDDARSRVICNLPGKRRVSIEKYKVVKLVSIRGCYNKKGITLTPKEWSAFCASFPDIEEAITKMESRMRDKCNEKKQTEAEPSNPSTSHPSLVPIATTRFTGKNYYCWKRQMEFFLNQSNIFYVLVEPCPKVPAPQIILSKSLEQKWINDDYICRHTILSSLSDRLFDQYSVKSQTAKELWDELNSLYADDYGTNLSHVNSYIHFEMVEGVSVLEQVQELHRIAHVINTSGITIDEKLHVGVIVSKLPPSWRQIQARLMQQEDLNLDNLVYQLKDEEDLRSQQKRETVSGKKDMKGLCFGCHKAGHQRRDCPLTRADNRDRCNR